MRQPNGDREQSGRAAAPDATPPRHTRVARRVLALARPYLALILAVALLTLLFSAGRLGRAYLMKPLLDGVLLPAPEATATRPAQPLPGEAWLSAPLTRWLPAPPAAAGETAVPGRDLASLRHTLAAILLAALLIVIITPCALFGRAYLSEYVLGRIQVDIKCAIAGKLLALPLSRHQAEKSGDLLSRIQNDANSASQALRLLLQEFGVAVVTIVAGVATLLAICWPLTLIALASAPAIVAVLALFGGRIRSSARRRQQQLGTVTQRLIGILTGIKVIKSFGGERLEQAAFARETRRLFRRELRVVRNRVFAQAVVEALNSAAGIAMLTIGALLVLRGRWGLTTGDLAAFATVLATTYKPLKNLSKGWAKLMEHFAASERFFAVLDADEEPADAPDAIAISGVERSIRFDDVSLAYPDSSGIRKLVLDRLSLEIRRGEVLGIAGRTGEGKTSLVDLLLRMHDVSGGSISIDGRDLRRITRHSLHEELAVVTQEPFLFDSTIGGNIRYGRPEASDEQVLAAARAAHVDEFAKALPLGYDTEVGEFGMRLSGGQRQRITIARALLRDPAVLIFDEATSALDAKTERAVQNAIESLRGNHTILIVTHRLSSIRNADRIVVLENGRVSQSGSHRELLAREGLYRELATLQNEPL